MNKKLLSTFVIILIVFSSLAFASVGSTLPTDKVAVIIGFKGVSDAALVHAFGGEITYQYQYIPAIAASLPPQAVAALQKNPNVAYVEPDFQVQALIRPVKPTPTPTSTPTPTPVPTQTVPWGISKIQAPSVWGTTKGDGVKVAVLDTGIDTSHSDLNVVGGKSYVFPGRSYNDDNGHGTHCAGIIAALDNNYGVVGVAPHAYLYAVKVLNSQGSGYISNINAGIEWCITNGIQVISMSFGSSSSSLSLESECSKAYKAGIVLVAAAGNSGSGTDTIGYPAHYSTVIAVGATDSNNVIAYFSSTGPSLSVVAPGVSIYSTYKGNTYATMSGTSMACPHVAGTVALMLSNGISATSVRSNLETTADPCPLQNGVDNTYGHGLVDAPKACV